MHILVFFLILIYPTFIRSRCSIPRGQTTFSWRNGLPFFFDEEGNECPIIMAKPAPSNETLIRVAAIGDSMQVSLCFQATGGGARAAAVTAAKWNEKIEFFICADDDIAKEMGFQLTMLRVFGMKGSIHGSSYSHGEVSSAVAISEFGLSTKKLYFGKFSKPEYIFYGSFLWDFLRFHQKFCESKNRPEKFQSSNISSAELCHKFNPDGSIRDVIVQNMTVTVALQDFQKIRPLPWCGLQNLMEWREDFMTNIDTILKTFPESKVFLRTQVISGGVFLGNIVCFTPYNEFIKYLTTFTAEKYWKFRKLSIPMPAYVVPQSQLFGLMDLYGLFSSPSDSNTTKLLSNDEIHLSSYGESVEYAYMRQIVREQRMRR